MGIASGIMHRWHEVTGYSRLADAHNLHGIERVRCRLDWLYWLIRQGCSADDYFAYGYSDKSAGQKSEYISLVQGAWLIHKLNSGDPAARKTVEDKRVFAQVFKDYLNRATIEPDSVDCVDDLRGMLEQYNQLIIKPTFGSNGDGIHIVNIKSVTNDELCKEFCLLKSGQVVIEEVLVQDGILRELNPNTLNTIRVNVFNNHGNLKLINAILRSGQGDVVTDNICAGGVVAWVNIDSGVIETPFCDLMGHRYKGHPKTGVKLLGKKIPHWNKAKEVALSAADRLGEGIPYSSWDIAICAGGIIAVVEGNSYGNFNIQQVPTNQGVRAVYRELVAEWERSGRN